MNRGMHPQLMTFRNKLRARITNSETSFYCTVCPGGGQVLVSPPPPHLPPQITSSPLFSLGIVKRVTHASARENCLPQGNATQGRKRRVSSREKMFARPLVGHSLYYP